MKIDLNKEDKAAHDDMALRLATARSSDQFGQAILPITANLTADEMVIDPEQERSNDLDSGA